MLAEGQKGKAGQEGKGELKEYVCRCRPRSNCALFQQGGVNRRKTAKKKNKALECETDGRCQVPLKTMPHLVEKCIALSSVCGASPKWMCLPPCR